MRKITDVSSYKKNYTEVVFYFIVLIATLLVWCIVLEVWRVDWHIPFDYGTELGTDVFGASTWIKGYVQNGFSWTQEDVSLPFSANRKSDFGVDRNILLLEIICSLFSSTYGASLNTLYLLSFLTTSITTAYCLRCLKFSKAICLAAAIIYTFLQYHLMRGELHLYLSFYYTVPLAILLMFWIVDESFLAERFFKCTVGRVRYAYIVFFLFSLLIGLQQPYYAFFSAIGICFALIYSLYHKHFKKVLESIVYLLIIAMTTLLANLYPLFYTSKEAMEYMRQQRTVGNLEVYGLKLINLLLPVQNHRLPILAKLRQYYDTLVGAGNSEEAWISLGLVLAVCFCTALIVVLVNGRADHRIQVCGYLILAFLLVATVGGVSSAIGLIFPLLRCYNRMVVFIAMLCVIVFAVLTERLGVYLSGKQLPWTVQCGLLMFLVTFALWDQTTPANVYDYEATQEEYLQDEEFIQAIEAIMPEGACIFELPMLPTGTTAIRDLRDYELSKPYLHAKSIKWLYMYSVGSRTDQWVNLLHSLPLRTVIDIIVCCDFQGVYLDSRGYAPDEWRETLAVMDSIEGTVVIQSEDGQKVFYSLTSYATTLKDQLGSEKVQQYAEFWLTCPNITCFPASGLYYTDETLPQGDGVVVSPGCMQYGPYITVQPGGYIVYVLGDNLKDMEYDLSGVNGTIQLPIQFLDRENSRVKYTFHVDTEIYGVEMRCTNVMENNSLISGVLLFNRDQVKEISMVEEFLENCSYSQTTY